MKTEEIKGLLQDILPAVDFDSDFLFAEMDSLGITMMVYSWTTRASFPSLTVPG